MLAFVMVLIFLLGFPFEWIEICLIVLPVFGPILMKFDFSDHLGSNACLMTWFGTLVAVNLQTAFMTPPFGATLFYMKGTAPPGVTMSDVYRAMYPFVALQVVGLMLCIYFPEIVLWLPRLAGLGRERGGGGAQGGGGGGADGGIFIRITISQVDAARMTAAAIHSAADRPGGATQPSLRCRRLRARWRRTASPSARSDRSARRCG